MSTKSGKKSEKKAAKEQAKAEKQARKEANKGKKTWKVMTKGSAVVAGVLATKALDATWRTATGHRPPNKAEHPGVSNREAFAWAAVSGMAMGVTKAAVNRRAVNYWMRSTGKPPPGLSGDAYAAKEKKAKKAKKK